MTIFKIEKDFRITLKRILGGLHNEKLHNVCSSSDIFMVIKSRKMRWAGRVERIREMRNI
jgi:hypothetical protein